MTGLVLRRTKGSRLTHAEMDGNWEFFEGRTTISVTEFGAVGDGVTINTQALQDGIEYAAANNKTLLIPSGRYLTGDLEISAEDGIDIIGQRHAPIANGVGSRLIYTGTGNCIGINTNGGSSFLYNVTLKDIGIEFSQNANAGVYAHNIQQCTFENVGVNGLDGQTIVHAFDFDGAGIVNIDNCVGQFVTNFLNIHFDASSQASGPIVITRNNVFHVTNGIVFGLVNFINIRDNWFEGFQNGLLLDNGAPRQRTESFNILVEGNTFNQSTAGLSETRVLKVVNSDNNKAIKTQGSFTRNTCFMNGGTATKPSYAVEFDLSGNTAGVASDIEISSNRFWGVTTAGITSDTAFPLIREWDNDTRDAFFGNKLPDVAGTAARLGAAYTLAQSAAGAAAPADTSENVLASIVVPATTLKANGVIRITTAWTCDNNANAKTIRVRFGGIGGTVVMEGSVANVSQARTVTEIANRNATNSQIGTSQGATSAPAVFFWLAAPSQDTTADVAIVITGQKGTAGDALTLESHLVEVMPK